MMKITVLTPDKEIFQGEINSVRVPGAQGQFQVLKGHAPIVSSLEEGVVYLVTAGGAYRYFDVESGQIKTDQRAGKEINYSISGGFIEVLNNEVSLMIHGLKREESSNNNE